MNKFSINNLSIKYLYGATAINDLNFEGSIGEVVAVFGTEESGKTSLLKSIAGILPVNSGRILIDDEDISDIPIKDRNVALVYENEGYFRFHNVKYNIIYPLKIRKYDSNIISQRLSEVQKILNIDKIMSTPMYKLSATDIFRVMLARLLIRKPSVVLLDNPLKQLNKPISQAIKEEIIRVINILKSNSLVLWATDNFYEAKDFDKIIVINYGIHLQTGSFDELRKVPNCLFIRQLFDKKFGYQNVTVKILSDEKGTYCAINGNKFYLPSDSVATYIDQEVWASYLVDGMKVDTDSFALFDYSNERRIYP